MTPKMKKYRPYYAAALLCFISAWRTLGTDSFATAIAAAAGLTVLITTLNREEKKNGKIRKL